MRVADVAPDGSSHLITTGIAPITGGAGQWRVTLAPTAYQVPAGHRIRIVVSSSDFPHVLPAVQADGSSSVLEVQGLRQHLLTIDPGAGCRQHFRRPRPPCRTASSVPRRCGRSGAT